MDGLARTLIIGGVGLVLAGVLVYLGGKLGFLGLGRLPGDIRVEREHVSFYFLIATCILISVILSLVMYLLSKYR